MYLIILVLCCVVLFVLLLCIMFPMLPMSLDIFILLFHSSSFNDVYLYYLWWYVLMKTTTTTTNNWDIVSRVIQCANYLRRTNVGFIRVLRFQPPWYRGNNNPDPFWDCFLCIQFDWTTRVFSINRNLITYENRCWNKNIYLIYTLLYACGTKHKPQESKYSCWDTRDIKPKPIHMSISTCISGFYGTVVV